MNTETAVAVVGRVGATEVGQLGRSDKRLLAAARCALAGADKVSARRQAISANGAKRAIDADGSGEGEPNGAASASGGGDVDDAAAALQHLGSDKGAPFFFFFCVYPTHVLQPGSGLPPCLCRVNIECCDLSLQRLWMVLPAVNIVALARLC